MSKVDELLEQVRLAASHTSYADLARQANVHEDTVRRLVRVSPAAKAITTLRKLEKVSGEIIAAKRAEAQSTTT